MALVMDVMARYDRFTIACWKATAVGREPERGRVGHEADHRGVGERGDTPLADERAHD